MTSAIILHGTCDADEYFDADFPSLSNAHWLPWLQQKFLHSGILCQTLEMPKPYAPNYQDWAAVFEQMHVNDDTIIVGHSAGAGFIVKWLHLNPQVRLQKLILVAPYLDPLKEHGDFLMVDLDPSVLQRIGETHILYSTDDDDDITHTKDRLMDAYPDIILHTFDTMGHFCYGDMGTDAFPELWDVCKG